MPHVELSLSEPLPLRGRESTETVDSSLMRWAQAAAQGAEPSLVIDENAEIVAVSSTARELLGLDESMTGRALLDVLHLLDFTADAAELNGGELSKIPPILAVTSGRLARGLLRIRSGETTRTLDAVATPLGGSVTEGSLTFFNTV